VAGLKEATDKARESIAAAQADLVTAQEHYSELHTLRKTGFVSQSRMTDASKTLADSRARLAQAKQSLRVALFALGGSVNQPINDNIHVKLAVAERDLAKLHLSETTVRAPYAGQIVNLHTAVGNYANKGSAQMTVVERNAWWVQANIKENNLAGVQVGNKALVSLSLYPGHVFSATVTGVGKGVNLNATVPANYLPYIEKSHNWVRLAQRFPVQLKLDKLSKKYPLRVGASATVTIFTCDSWFWNSLGGIWQWVRSEFSYFS
jgi:multidrug resistance efflux pump